MAENTENVIDIRAKVEERAKAIEETLAGQPGAGSGGGDDINSKFVVDCMYANSLGDGVLYATMHKNKFLYNNSSEAWLRWAGHHWERDINNDSLINVETVAEKYAEVAAGMDPERDGETIKAMRKRAYRLRGDMGRTGCLKFARTNFDSVAIHGDELDCRPWLLACPNGVIDLRTGQMRSGRAEDFLLKSCTTDFISLDADAAPWDEFLLTILDNNTDLYLYMQRLLGYALIGRNIEHIFPVLTGEGRNGKSVIIETLRYVLGDLAGPIQAAMLLDQGRVKNSSGPSPDIMTLKGLRLAFASETDDGCRISPSRVKWLTGGDTLVGREPNAKHEVYFTPTHTLFLLTNHIPDAPSDDYAFWKRIHIIPFKLSFVDNPQLENERQEDKDLPEKLKKYASGILSWLVRGCLEWQKQGLNPPDIVKKATLEKKRKDDLIADFIDECCFVDRENKELRTRSRDLYDRFKKWYEDNVSKRTPPSHKRFGTAMAKRGFLSDKKDNGYIFYYCIGLLTDED